MKIDLEEAERIINAGLIGTRPTDEGLKFGLALCAENKKLRELVGAQKELDELYWHKISSLVTRPDQQEWKHFLLRVGELRTKIAGLTKEMG